MKLNDGSYHLNEAREMLTSVWVTPLHKPYPRKCTQFFFHEQSGVPSEYFMVLSREDSRKIKSLINSTGCSNIRMSEKEGEQVRISIVMHEPEVKPLMKPPKGVWRPGKRYER